MASTQIQLKISLTDQLYDFLRGQSSRLGIPITQVVKHLIVTEAKKDVFPTFKASKGSIRLAQKAITDYKNGKFIPVEDVSEYFKNI